MAGRVPRNVGLETRPPYLRPAAVSASAVPSSGSIRAAAAAAEGRAGRSAAGCAGRGAGGGLGVTSAAALGTAAGLGDAAGRPLSAGRLDPAASAAADSALGSAGTAGCAASSLRPSIGPARVGAPGPPACAAAVGISGGPAAKALARHIYPVGPGRSSPAAAVMDTLPQLRATVAAVGAHGMPSGTRGSILRAGKIGGEGDAPGMRIRCGGDGPGGGGPRSRSGRAATGSTLAERGCSR